MEYLESPKTDIRRAAQQSLLYLLQGERALFHSAYSRAGNFGDTTSPEMQLHWVIENAKMVRSLDGTATLVVALKDAVRRYNLIK